jgi:hypothetical protein
LQITLRTQLPVLMPGILAALQDKDAASSNNSSSSSNPQQQAAKQPATGSSSSSTAVDSSNPAIAGADSQQLQVSKEVIETLRNKVFGECFGQHLFVGGRGGGRT